MRGKMSLTPKLRRAVVGVITLSCILSVIDYIFYEEIPVLALSGLVHQDKRTYVQEHLQCNCLCKNSSSRVSQACKLFGCSYLDDFSLNRLHACVASKRARLVASENQQVNCRKSMTFLNHTGSFVALVSFPGSGSSWVRYLLEQATGIYTGSIYCDTTLKAHFPGEFIVNSNVAAVKTHHFDSVALPSAIKGYYGKHKFDKAIVIVRDPYDALVSEANRQWSNVHKSEKHIGLATETDFIGNAKWDWFVEYKGFSWFMLLNTWIKESHMPVLVVQYEKLKANLTDEVKKIVDFLKLSPVSDKMLKCLTINNEGYLQRKKHLHFDPYTPELKQLTNTIINRANSLLKAYDIQYNPR